MSDVRAVFQGFGQAIIVIFICGLTVLGTAFLQRWEASADGYLDKVALILLFGVAALVSGTVVMACPAYLVLQQRIREGFLLLLLTIIWLVLMLGGILISIIFFDIHTIS